MGLTPEQRAKFLSALTVQKRAAVTGTPIQIDTKKDARLIKHIDSANTQRQLNAPAEPIRTVIQRGTISLPGAPQTLEDSGLAAAGFQFDPSQEEAIRTLVSDRHVCLIGQAGTGKTTMVKHALAHLIYGSDLVTNPVGIRRLEGEQGPSIAICAFTGIATQVIKDTLPKWLHGACKTIHQLLEFKPTEKGEVGMFKPTRTEERKLDHDIIVIDEASMLGLDLWHSLVAALRPRTKVILIGDLNQLKPVADATMFAYALSAGIDKVDGWDIAELTTIHRQKEPAANKIIDGATAILNGKKPVFDDPKTDPDWRFIGFELPPQAQNAHTHIVGAVDYLRKQPTPGNPERPLFDPYRDLLLCAGNGHDTNDASAFVQQVPLNESLSRVIEPVDAEHPQYIIDAGRAVKRFAVGHRVIATKNESPDTKDRVTNGLSGRITKIVSNPKWNGNRSLFGAEEEVKAYRKAKAMAALSADLDSFSLAGFDTSKIDADAGPVERQASHIVSVKYVNGAERTYMTAADVESIQLAYAVTVHKAQGSQADTVIIVCHQAAKRQLNREWLYTGVTRAKRRVVMLYTPLGLSTAVSRQQIYGKDLREKVNRYRQVMENGNVIVQLRAHDVTLIRGPMDSNEEE